MINIPFSHSNTIRNIGRVVLFFVETVVVFGQPLIQGEGSSGGWPAEFLNFAPWTLYGTSAALVWTP